MKLIFSLFAAQVASLGSRFADAACDGPGTLVCMPTTSPPMLDADLAEWENVQGISTTLQMITGTVSADGETTIKCMHDDTNIYFSFEIPGAYRFNSTDNKQCAAIGTMFKVGAKATYVNMGGCPDGTAAQCANGVPDTCSDYLVDIGAHWELSGTEQNVEYPVNSATGTGNDLVANNDDEYAVGAYCRFDDDDANAGNEWGGAWAHTNSTIGAMGSYIFELSRLLKTPSNVTDVQLSSGDTYGFGVAFWDPFEIESTGWTDAGHYVTGCANQWIDLVLSDGTDMQGASSMGAGNGASTPSKVGMLSGSLLALAVALFTNY